jgi:hypothetical protein
MNELDATVMKRLENAKNIWIATVRPNGRPHLVPIWFAWHEGKLFACIEASSVKGRNLQENSYLSLALEDGSSPIICEGTARALPHPWPKPVVEQFDQKYAWDIENDGQYDQVIEILPERWLTW